MSNVYKAKATFTIIKDKAGKRSFVAVNKRAKTVARKLGKRKYLSLDELKSSVGKGSYEFYAYKNNTDYTGGLVKIRF